MTTLLRIDSSAKTAGSDSRALAEHFVSSWKAQHPVGRVLVRDVGQEPIPHVDALTLAALGTPAQERDDAMQRRAALADELLHEFVAADHVVIAVPMYNFGIPSTLKAYLDHVARAGVTFRYTEAGPEGLATGKRVTLLLTRGGRYAGSPLDHQEPYLRTFLNFLGITDIEVVVAEGLNISESDREQALEAALARMGDEEAA